MLKNTEQMVSVPMSTLEKCLRDANLVRFTCDKHVLLLQDLLSQPAAQHQGEPVAYAVFAANGNIRIWSTNCEAVGIKVMQEEGKQAVPLYLHPPTSEGFSAGDMADQGAKAFREGVAASANFIQKRMDDYLNEFGAIDPETGSVELPRGGDEYVGELQEIIEAVRALPMPQ